MHPPPPHTHTCNASEWLYWSFDPWESIRPFEHGNFIVEKLLSMRTLKPLAEILCVCVCGRFWYINVSTQDRAMYTKKLIIIGFSTICLCILIYSVQYISSERRELGPVRRVIKSVSMETVFIKLRCQHHKFFHLSTRRLSTDEQIESGKMAPFVL